MLRVTIELIPAGNESLKKTIGVAHIINCGGDKDYANYRIVEMIETRIRLWEARHIHRHPNVFRFLEDLFSTTSKLPVKLPESKEFI